MNRIMEQLMNKLDIDMNGKVRDINGGLDWKANRIYSRNGHPKLQMMGASQIDLNGNGDEFVVLLVGLRGRDSLVALKDIITT